MGDRFIPAAFSLSASAALGEAPLPSGGSSLWRAAVAANAAAEAGRGQASRRRSLAATNPWVVGSEAHGNRMQGHLLHAELAEPGAAAAADLSGSSSRNRGGGGWSPAASALTTASGFAALSAFDARLDDDDAGGAGSDGNGEEDGGGVADWRTRRRMGSTSPQPPRVPALASTPSRTAAQQRQSSPAPSTSSPLQRVLHLQSAPRAACSPLRDALRDASSAIATHSLAHLSDASAALLHEKRKPRRKISRVPFKVRGSGCTNERN